MSYDLSFSDLEKETSIPGNTLRRYAKRFKFFLPSKLINRTQKFSQDSIEVFRRINELYNQGLKTNEVDNKLQAEFSTTLDIAEDEKPDHTLTQMLMKTLQATLETQQSQQQALPNLTSEKNILERLERIEARLDELEANQKKSWWQRVIRK